MTRNPEVTHRFPSPFLSCDETARSASLSVKQECLSKVILFGEGPLLRVLTGYCRHYHHERNHQGKSNRLLFPDMGETRTPRRRSAECHQRLGGLLKIIETRHEYFDQTGMMMKPEASVRARVFQHPDCVYFGAGESDRAVA